MVLVRLYGNSWKWQLLRRYFAEWNNRMDQFGDMCKTKQVVHAETSISGASGKRRYTRHPSNKEYTSLFRLRYFVVQNCSLSQSFLDMLPPLLLKGKTGEMPGAGQSHLIFGTGSTGCVTINQPSKPCCANAFYKLLENLDAIACRCG